MEQALKLSRREKFKHLKAMGIKCKANMTNKQLDALIRGDKEEAKPTPRQKREGKKRIPLGQHRAKMDISGYDIPSTKVPRWVNDKGGRIQDALNGGYEFVQDPEKEMDIGQDPLRRPGMGSAVNISVGVEDDGRPIKGYLMVIDKELYEEDQAFKQAQQEELMKSIREGTHQSDPHDGKYSPDGGIKINS
jgi:hypothetical protein